MGVGIVFGFSIIFSMDNFMFSMVSSDFISMFVIDEFVMAMFIDVSGFDVFICSGVFMFIV